MKALHAANGDYLLGLKNADPGFLSEPQQFSCYTVLCIQEGKGLYHADFGTFAFEGPVLLFATPLQVIYLEQHAPASFHMLQFHGDFYCIEYHRAEVACNGLLFNSIYIEPSICLSPEEVGGFAQVFSQMDGELQQEAPSEIVLRAFLQLFLAKSSSVKMKMMAAERATLVKDEQMEQFRQLLETNYRTLRKPNDYAGLLAMSPNTFTKRCTKYFRKTPSLLIQERLILEAKKQLHLTRLSIKEIAFKLEFSDEFYFSRVFKKFTRVSPQAFRDKTGISIVADMSM